MQTSSPSSETPAACASCWPCGRGASVGELSRATGQSDSGVSHALQLLRAHRIVAVRREGRRAFYRLDDPHVRMLLDLALSHTEHSALEHPERGVGATGAASDAAAGTVEQAGA